MKLKDNIYGRSYVTHVGMDMDYDRLFHDGVEILYCGNIDYIEETTAQDFVPYIKSQGVYQNYQGFLDDAWNCDTAIKSLKSALPFQYCLIYKI